MASKDEILAESLQEFSQLQTMRATFGTHWEEVAELVLPTSRNTFFYGNYNTPGQKKTEQQVDASAALALERFSAIFNSMLTPANQTWHQLGASDPHLMKDRATRLWFEAATKTLFKYRYMPIANFASQNNNVYQSLGAFGNGTMFVDSFQGVEGQKGLRYKNLPLGEMYFRENHQGLIDGFCRWFRLTPQQALKQFEPDSIPDGVKALAEQAAQMPLDFLHRVCPRDDYDPDRYDAKGKPYASYYICLNPKALLTVKGAKDWEGGYTSFPAPTSRYIQTPGEVYGRGPAMQVLPAIKTLNAEKRDFLTQGHRAVAPVLLTYDDGVMDGVSLRPGALNKGGVSSDGKALIQTLPIGNIQVSKEMMDEERSLIDSSFLVDLFKLLLDSDPKVFTATQVTEMMAQRGILIAPTIGRQQSEYLGPLIERELDVLSDLRLLPPMPPLLREAGGDFQVIYTSPLARDMRAQEAAGFMRWMETLIQIANVTGDPSVFDRVNIDEANPALADINGVPILWVASDEQVAQKQQARAQAQAKQEQIQAAPAAAALLKAHAAAGKAGLTPGQLGSPVGPGGQGL